MTDNEIIKALECCDIYHQCEGCPRDFNTNGKTSCVKLGEDIRDLINRQKAEIEKLKADFEACKRDYLIELNNHKYVRLEAIRAFAEKLKRKSELLASSVYAEPYRAVSIDDIDNLVKEMTEEKNG